MTKTVSLLLILLLSSQLLFAQSTSPQQRKPTQTQQKQPTPQSTEDDVIRIDVNLVQVDAVVTDKRGKQVTDLKAEDFAVIEMA